MSRAIRVGVLQFFPRFGDLAGNLDRIAGLLSRRRADLWVLPELCSTGYQFRSRAEAARLAEPADGRLSRFLGELARERNAVFVAGFAERAGKRLFNSALVVGPRGTLGVYRKVHLFHRERRIFSPGASLPVFRTPWGRLGVLICYDWRFPEAARTLALRGAGLIAHPANLVFPDAPRAMVTRSLENRVFAVTADRTGAEARIPGERLRFFGGSQVATPHGKVLFRLGREEAARTVRIDLAGAADKRLTASNHILRDRRPAVYLR